MSDCSFTKQDVSRTGTAEICLKHGRERVYCEKAEAEEHLKVAVDALEKIAGVPGKCVIGTPETNWSERYKRIARKALEQIQEI